MKIKIIVVALVALIFLVMGCSPGSVSIAAASLPSTNVGDGEATIFRFAVTAPEDRDVQIETMTLTRRIEGRVILHLRHWYDANTAIPMASFQTTEHERITIWALNPPTIPAGTTKIFSIQGEVKGNGTLLMNLEAITIKGGAQIQGLPTATTTLTVH